MIVARDFRIPARSLGDYKAVRGQTPQAKRPTRLALIRCVAMRCEPTAKDVARIREALQERGWPAADTRIEVVTGPSLRGEASAHGEVTVEIVVEPSGARPANRQNLARARQGLAA